MSWKRRSEMKGVRVTPSDVKLCALCGALNHTENPECFTCGWHGIFSGDAQTLALAWQRLDAQFEGVRLEHVTSRRQTLVGELGVVQTTGHRQRFCADFARRWRAFLRGRDARAAARDASLRPRSSASGNELGV